MHDMMLRRADDGAVDIDALKQRLEVCFLAVMLGRLENDGYNALVLEAVGRKPSESLSLGNVTG